MPVQLIIDHASGNIWVNGELVKLPYAHTEHDGNKFAIVFDVTDDTIVHVNQQQ